MFISTHYETDLFPPSPESLTSLWFLWFLWSHWFLWFLWSQWSQWSQWSLWFLWFLPLQSGSGDVHLVVDAVLGGSLLQGLADGTDQIAFDPEGFVQPVLGHGLAQLLQD